MNTPGKSGLFISAAILGTCAIGCFGYLLFASIRESHPFFLLFSIAIMCIGVIAIWVSLFGLSVPINTTQGMWAEAFKKPPSTIVRKRKFANEQVEMDGNSFRDCSFINTKLMYRGNAPTEILGTSEIGGSAILVTDNPAIDLYVKLYQLITSGPGVQIRDGDNGPAYRKQHVGPKVVVKGIIHNRAGLFPETKLTLHNASMEDGAQKIRIGDLKICGATVSFREIPLLGANEEQTVVPEIKNPSDVHQVFHQHDLVRAVHEEWVKQKGVDLQDWKNEFVVNAVIHYDDLDNATYETVFDLCFFPRDHYLKEVAGSQQVRDKQVILEAKRL